MIPAMVALAQIMSEASHQLYHSMRRSIADKSRLAMALDQRLLEWKATLPAFLDLDALALNDPEWAFKQKLVLRLSEFPLHDPCSDLAHPRKNPDRTMSRILQYSNPHPQAIPFGSNCKYRRFLARPFCPSTYLPQCCPDEYQYAIRVIHA